MKFNFTLCKKMMNKILKRLQTNSSRKLSVLFVQSNNRSRMRQILPGANRRKKLYFAFTLFLASSGMAQSPAITSWLQNTSAIGNYYVSGNSNLIPNNIVVNCQLVQYSANNVYVSTHGIPAYPTGPFLDGNPSQASDQNAIFKFPLAPVQNTGTPTATTGGDIGVFINGVALFDYRDGVAWNSNTNALCGGPGNPPCPGGMGATMDWNRDAIVAERAGFDCAKGHPAMGNYHHHQNPSAFKLDLTVISNVCNLYDADGLYAIDSTQHSPLIGFAYDGFPIYGAYAYLNTNGSGGIVRMKSGYQLRNITTRTTDPNGNAVSAGPAVSTTYPLGYFREDYEFIAHPSDPDYLDEHNGRFCVTPEYPSGTYCYFATVNDQWNSAYPYVVGPTFYGVYANRKVTSVTEPTTVYVPTTSIAVNSEASPLSLSVFPNPASDLLVIQTKELVLTGMEIQLVDMNGKVISSTKINQGSTIAYFDLRTVYDGNYIVKASDGIRKYVQKVVLARE